MSFLWEEEEKVVMVKYLIRHVGVGCVGSWIMMCILLDAEKVFSSVDRKQRKFKFLGCVENQADIRKAMILHTMRVVYVLLK